ncbi:MAG: hypothetical protein HON76_09460 [Candidatus Scalindua sp.]|jgi:hypothetical protein|nr:hypothetical protein [Candidatus Scalindua sp.]MBT5304206.1 hypothetical protein [Candidatus Scalindua sp.]MBT6053196.1 hypothetical protein [Candidatus Scalindua sp.]MBT6230570.1 hypothetical protein [Candidatus Scalindua sp.]MBT6562741.1 hypothetical protein [Candidatus Scalindua sp.]
MVVRFGRLLFIAMFSLVVVGFYSTSEIFLVGKGNDTAWADDGSSDDDSSGHHKKKDKHGHNDDDSSDDTTGGGQTPPTVDTSFPLVINDAQLNSAFQITFTPNSLFTLDFAEIPGTQIRLLFRGFVRGPTATKAEYQLAINQSWPPNPVAILGSAVSTTSSTPDVIDTGWISYTKPTGIAMLLIQARVNAAAGTFEDAAMSQAATIWFK